MKILILLLLFTHFAVAIESQFDGGQTTSFGEINQQPAGLAGLNNKYSFAASGTSFEFTDYKSHSGLSEEQNSPISMRPIYIASAMSTSYGGWSLVISNGDYSFKGSGIEYKGGLAEERSLNQKITNVLAVISTGLSLSENWSIGWSLGLSQTQAEIENEISINNGTSSSLILSEASFQSTSLIPAMGFIFKTDELVIGFKGSYSEIVLGKSEKGRARFIIGSTYSDQKTNASFENADSFVFDTGIRFGRSGFSYILSDQYDTGGRHWYDFGFEYVAPWGTLASGFGYSNFKKTTSQNLTVGFIKDHKNFKWGVGPFYLDNRDKNTSSFNKTSYGVQYASEIRY